MRSLVSRRPNVNLVFIRLRASARSRRPPFDSWLPAVGKTGKALFSVFQDSTISTVPKDVVREAVRDIHSDCVARIARESASEAARVEKESAREAAQVAKEYARVIERVTKE